MPSFEWFLFGVQASTVEPNWGEWLTREAHVHASGCHKTASSQITGLPPSCPSVIRSSTTHASFSFQAVPNSNPATPASTRRSGT